MDYEKNAIEILRIIGSNSGFTVADSGGKDSSVLTHIAMKAGCPFEVVHNHTTVDAPETVYFIREKFKKLRAAGIKAEIVMPKETMWQLIVRKKTPPTRLIRYCCHRGSKAGVERKRPDQTALEQQYHTRQWTSPELWNCTAMSQTNS